MADAMSVTSRWWILAAMGLILGVILLDETVLGVALPTIQTDLATSELMSHWVVNIYLLVLAGVAAAAGKFGDIVGHKILMVVGLAIFGLASLASGFAESGAWLVVTRGIQGLGAAIIFPSSLAMVTLAFPPSQHGMALGIYGAVGTTFLALGPFVGGLLTEVASWRWIFWINPPIVVIIAAIVLVRWRDPAGAVSGGRVDGVGAGLLVGGLSAIVFSIMQAPEWGWTNPAILALLIAGIVIMVVFTVFELRKRAPLIDVELFANPTFTGCNLAIFAAQYSKMAVFIFTAMYFQDVLGMDPIHAGLALLPAVAPQVITAPLAGMAADRFGARWPTLLALAGTVLGFVIFSLGVDAGSSYIWLFPGVLLWGLTTAFLFVPPQRAVMGAVPPAKQGQAGGIVMSAQLLGGTLGMAVCSTLFATTGGFDAVFWSTAGLNLIILIVGWLTIERSAPRAPVPA
ncbi:MFS transporter [Bauldia sp.]|uniref:MFS transporter n=1 Tax=Bauldia sp. TaxID=2575872 RepID=UPI003BAD8CBA